MKLTLPATLLFTTLALATPAPNPGAVVPETVPDFRHALMGRHLDPRAVKPKGSSSGGSSSNSSAAASVSTSGALMVGALGLGVMQVVQLWA